MIYSAKIHKYLKLLKLYKLNNIKYLYIKY